MTAKGKVTTARLHEGSRIQVRLADGYRASPTRPPTRSRTPTPSSSRRSSTRRRRRGSVGPTTSPARSTARPTPPTSDRSPDVLDRTARKEARREATSPVPLVLDQGDGGAPPAGCGDIERDRERRCSNLQAFEATDLEAAAAVVIDDEMTEMGYDHSHVRVYPCVTPHRAKEGNKMATATATRKTASKPAPASARKNGKATVTRKAAVTESANLVAKESTVKGPQQKRLEADQAKRAAAKKATAQATASTSRPRPSGTGSSRRSAGSTIGEIAEGLGLPAEHRSGSASRRSARGGRLPQAEPSASEVLVTGPGPLRRLRPGRPNVPAEGVSRPLRVP